jgi:hypothetical protein
MLDSLLNTFPHFRHDIDMVIWKERFVHMLKTYLCLYTHHSTIYLHMMDDSVTSSPSSSVVSSLSCNSSSRTQSLRSYSTRFKYRLQRPYNATSVGHRMSCQSLSPNKSLSSQMGSCAIKDEPSLSGGLRFVSSCVRCSIFDCS